MSVVSTKEFADLQKMLDSGSVGTSTNKTFSASYLLDLGATALTGGASSLVGGVTGILGNLIPGLSGFLSTGSFSCLGGQAYNKEDQAAHLSQMSERVNWTASGQWQVETLLSWFAEMIQCMYLELGRFSSACSKQYMQDSINKFQAAYDAIDKTNYAYNPVTKTDWKGAQYTFASWYKKTGTNAGNTNVDAPFTLENLPPVSASFSGMTVSDFQNTAVPALTAFATQNNLNPVDVINHYATELFGSNSGINGSWQIGGTANAGGTFGNQQNNLLNYLLIGGGALLLFNTLKK